MVKKKDPKKGIANSYIIDIKEDKKGNLWVATIGGVSKINTETDSIKKLLQ